jgi:hypothetical protein
VLSIVEIPIVFSCLNVFVTLNFMLEVCYLNVLVLVISIVEACCVTPIDIQTSSSSSFHICSCSVLSNFVNCHFGCSTTIILFSKFIVCIKLKQNFRSAPLHFFQVHKSYICLVHKLFMYVSSKLINYR